MNIGDVFQLKAGDKVDERFLPASDPCIGKDWVVRNVVKETHRMFDGRETVYSTWVSAVSLDGSIEKPIRFAIEHSHYPHSHIVVPTIVGTATMKWVMN